MSIFYTDGQVTLLQGDCIELLKQMLDCSVDSVVTDPPYELGLMGKSWDSTGIAYNVDMWREVLRVLKPGGHMLAFGGTRTYHRMACAIEDAGFEVRDQCQWIYFSGFPKSLNVSKAIDGVLGAEREVVGTKRLDGNAAQTTKEKGGTYASNTNSVGVAAIDVPITKPGSPEAEEWDGWGTALKPAHEPICLARKPLGEKNVALNVLKHGTGAINVDGCRVGEESLTYNLHGTPGAGRERSCNLVDRGDGKTPDGRDLQKILARHDAKEKNATEVTVAGRWPSNVIIDEEVGKMLPHTGPSKIGRPRKGRNGDGWGMSHTGAEYDDSGSASRFFYCPKASKAEREQGLDSLELKTRNRVNPGGIENDPKWAPVQRKNTHPTVKPIALMRYLCRMITPSGGTVLDPFTGSGSTGIAALAEGFNFIGAEIDPEYCEIARHRIRPEAKGERAEQGSLFLQSEV